MLKHIWRHVSAGVNVDDNMVYLDIPKRTIEKPL